MRLAPSVSWNAGSAAKPSSWIIRRPRYRKLRRPCWARSDRLGKFDMSARMVPTLATSSVDIPIQGVPQIRWLSARSSPVEPPPTSPRPPSSPCPYNVGFAPSVAVASSGRKQANSAAIVGASGLTWGVSIGPGVGVP
jgi:hypothetical protein